MSKHNQPAARTDEPTIAALLVVHNEEEYIRDALKSAVDTVDRIVVYHDGPCSDDTLKIAAEFTDDIHCTGEKLGSAQFLRPMALSGIDADWVLVLDSDERLSPDLRRALRSLTDNPNADSYGFAWPYVDERLRPIQRVSRTGKRFLFRRSMMYTIGLPHMTPNTYGKNISRPDLEVWHVTKHPGSWSRLGRMLRVNKKRARRASAILRGGAGAVETYRVDVRENRAGNVRKIRLFANHPFVAFFLVPPFIFLRRYFLLGYFRSGLNGLHDALNIPVYYAWLGLYCIRDRLKGNAAAA